jgi:hypothetical protein
MTNQANHLVLQNIGLLRQGVDVLASVDPSLYGRANGRSSIGSHFRHCLDFFGSFLRGAPSGRVDYCDRERDDRLARCFAAATSRVEYIVAGLEPFRHRDAHAPLLVRAEDAGDASLHDAWTRSSLGRELQAILSHTVHHYAIVAIVLRAEGCEPGAEFGVSPSTLAHWRRAS